MEDESFENDGVAVDYAGPEQNSNMDDITDEEGPDVLVIDTAEPSVHPAPESKADDVREHREEIKSGGDSHQKEMVSHSPKGKDISHEKPSKENDDEPYLEIMVSEQEFDDVGEMNGQDVNIASAKEKELGRTKGSSTKDTPSSSSGNKGSSSKTDDTTSATPSSSTGASSTRRTTRSSSGRGERGPAASDNQVTSSEKSSKDSGKSSSSSSKTTEKDKNRPKSGETSSAKNSGNSTTPSSSTSKAKSSEEKKPREREERPKEREEKKKPKDEPTAAASTGLNETATSETVVERSDKTTVEASPPVVDSGKTAESPEIEAPGNAAKETPVKPEPDDDGHYSVSIRSLAVTTTANQIKEKLVEIAPVFGCTIYLRKDDERYALVKFGTLEDCHACVEKFNNVELDGNVLTVALAVKRPKASTTPVKSEADASVDKKRRNGGEEKTSDGRRVVRTKKEGDKGKSEKNGVAKKSSPSEGGRTRPLRIRSPIRPPARSPNGKASSSTDDRSRRTARVASPVRARSPRQIERERARADFEERKRVLDWKRAQQDRMRREEDLMRKKAEVEELRLERERARLKLERERLEAERMQLERQKNRDRDLLDRDRKRREDEERRARQEREREKERERDRDRDSRRGDKRSTRDYDRDSDRLPAKRRSAEPSSRHVRLDDRDRESRREVLHVSDRGYDRPRAASPRRRGDSPGRGSPGRAKTDRYVVATRFPTFERHSPIPDRDRGVAVPRDNREPARRFPEFRGGERGAGDYTARRPENGRSGDTWNGSGSYSAPVAAPIGPTGWSTSVVGGSAVNSSAGHGSTAPYAGGGMGSGQAGQYLDRGYTGSAYPAPAALRGSRGY